MANDDNLFSFIFFLSKGFTLLSSAISHLKEDFETAWASGSEVTRKHFKDKIFIILWARHPENLGEKEQIQN